MRTPLARALIALALLSAACRLAARRAGSHRCRPDRLRPERQYLAARPGRRIAPAVDHERRERRPRLVARWPVDRLQPAGRRAGASLAYCRWLGPGATDEQPAGRHAAGLLAGRGAVLGARDQRMARLAGGVRAAGPLPGHAAAGGRAQTQVDDSGERTCFNPAAISVGAAIGWRFRWCATWD